MDMNQTTDLVGLLSSRHFGLAGMMERAELVGAKLLIDSVPGKGSQISHKWSLE